MMQAGCGQRSVGAGALGRQRQRASRAALTSSSVSVRSGARNLSAKASDRWPCRHLARRRRRRTARSTRAASPAPAARAAVDLGHRHRDRRRRRRRHGRPRGTTRATAPRTASASHREQRDRGRAPSRRCAAGRPSAATTRGCSSPAWPTTTSADAQRRAATGVERRVLVLVHLRARRPPSPATRRAASIASAQAGGRPSPHQAASLPAGRRAPGRRRRGSRCSGSRRRARRCTSSGGRPPPPQDDAVRSWPPTARRPGRSRTPRRPWRRDRRCAAAWSAVRAAAWCAAWARRRRSG